MRSALEEISAWHRFLHHTPPAAKALVFYAEHAGYFIYFEGLIEELIHRHRQKICYITSDPTDPILQTSRPDLRPFYLNKLLPFFMAFVNCRVFIMTLTDLNLFHLKRSVNPVKYVYVFHALSSTMGYRYGAFDHYDAVLCAGPHQVKEIRKHEELNHLPPKLLLPVGYYRLERIYAEYQEYSRRRKPGSEPATILIAPTWGANVLESYGENLVEILLKNGYQVVVRPHPETMRRSPDLIRKLCSKFGLDPKFTLEKSIASLESLVRADVLICDCYSGIFLEYAFGTERPVLFLDVSVDYQKRHFNPRFQELGIEPLEQAIRPQIGVTVSPRESSVILQVISDLLARREIYRKRLIQLRDQNVYAFGRSSEIGAQGIVELARGAVGKGSPDNHRGG